MTANSRLYKHEADRKEVGREPLDLKYVTTITFPHMLP